VATRDDKEPEGRGRGRKGRKADDGSARDKDAPPGEPGRAAGGDEPDTGEPEEGATDEVPPDADAGEDDGKAEGTAGQETGPADGVPAPASTERIDTNRKMPSGEQPVVKAVRMAAADRQQGGNGMAGIYLSPGVYVEEVPSATQPIAGVGTSTAGFIGFFKLPVEIYQFNEETNKFELAPFGEKPASAADSTKAGPGAAAKGAPDSAGSTSVSGPAKSGKPKLCTNMGDFRRFFGDFSTDPGQRRLAHAVYGFFRNGGTRCYVMRWDDTASAGVDPVLPFEAIDEIAIVAAPGETDEGVRQAVVDHCKKLKDRFAILDTEEQIGGDNLDLAAVRGKLANTTFAAVYFPWIKVADPVTKHQNPDGDGLLAVPPSGHVAGVYARVDTTRGVHKAPANEVIMGAQDTVVPITRAIQDGLNPKGINCLRIFNNNVVIWGARTLGGDDNGEFKYVNVRRTMLFLAESIDEGTQGTVFEPNDQTLWGKIRRNVTAFLLTVWRNGALFGSTPAEAFYVKCDAETNPPEQRDLGQVVCEIGIAIVRPAEFVIFRITQWAGPQKSS
jgi:phage tail sheath protein FI